MITGLLTRRRLAIVASTGLLVVALTGCTVGTATIPEGDSRTAVFCSGTKAVFVAGPETTHLRFEVLRSDSTQPLIAAVSWRLPPNSTYDMAFGETVWDGQASTGPQEVPWSTAARPNSSAFLATQSFEPAVAPITTTWVLTALDDDNKDVGITCAR